MQLPKGKDTTVIFEAGAQAVAGIDREKTLVSLKGTSLTDALDILSGQGIIIAVMEGYKGSALPKIIICDLEAEGCVLRDRDPEDAIPALDRLPDFSSRGDPSGARKRVRKEGWGNSSWPLPSYLCQREIKEMPSHLLNGLSLISSGRLRISAGSSRGGP